MADQTISTGQQGLAVKHTDLGDGSWSPTAAVSRLLVLLAGEDQVANRLLVEQRNSYTNITLAAPTATVCKTGPGLLHAITFNKPVATGVVTLYDNTAASGTIIGTITVPASPMPVTVIYDVQFATGLTVNTATAAQDITVSWR